LAQDKCFDCVTRYIFCVAMGRVSVRVCVCVCVCVVCVRVVGAVQLSAGPGKLHLMQACDDNELAEQANIRDVAGRGNSVTNVCYTAENGCYLGVSIEAFMESRFGKHITNELINKGAPNKATAAMFWATVANKVYLLSDQKGGYLMVNQQILTTIYFLFHMWNNLGVGTNVANQIEGKGGYSELEAVVLAGKLKVNLDSDCQTMPTDAVFNRKTVVDVVEHTWVQAQEPVRSWFSRELVDQYKAEGTVVGISFGWGKQFREGAHVVLLGEVGAGGSFVWVWDPGCANRLKIMFGTLLWKADGTNKCKDGLFPDGFIKGLNQPGSADTNVITITGLQVWKFNKEKDVDADTPINLRKACEEIISLDQVSSTEIYH